MTSSEKHFARALGKQGFTEMYAKNSNLSLERLQELGLYAIPCYCDEGDCAGWQMVTKGCDPSNLFA